MMTKKQNVALAKEYLRKAQRLQLKAFCRGLNCDIDTRGLKDAEPWFTVSISEEGWHKKEEGENRKYYSRMLNCFHYSFWDEAEKRDELDKRIEELEAAIIDFGGNEARRLK